MKVKLNYYVNEHTPRQQQIPSQSPPLTHTLHPLPLLHSTHGLVQSDLCHQTLNHMISINSTFFQCPSSGLLILSVDKMDKRGDERGERTSVCMVGLRKAKKKRWSKGGQRGGKEERGRGKRGRGREKGKHNIKNERKEKDGEKEREEGGKGE